MQCISHISKIMVSRLNFLLFSNFITNWFIFIIFFHFHFLGNGSVGVFYQPTEVGPHSLDVRNNGEHVQGSPFKFYASPNDEGKVYAYGPGLSHGVCGDSSNFVISTKGDILSLFWPKKYILKPKFDCLLTFWCGP